MKRFIIICALGVLSLFAVGCNKTMDLTDEENELVAEYAAELLLKYGTSIDFKYYYEAEPTTEATTTELSEETTEETTEAVTEVSESATEVQEASSESATDMEEASQESATEASDYNLAELFGEDGVSIKYSYGMLLDTYPSYDQDGVYMEISAPEGYKLLVLKFNVENITNESRELDLYSKDVAYKIILNNSKSANQMLTILMDDLYTYQKTMEPSMFEEDVVLFQVSSDVASEMQDIQDLKLEVTYAGKQVVLQLQ